MAQPKSPVTAKTGSSRILPVGTTEQAHFGLNSSLQSKNGGGRETAPLG